MVAHKYLPFGDRSVHLAHGGPTSLPTDPPSLGDGTACLLVHAAGGSAGTWGPVVDQLPASRPWAAIDLPAHGRSGGIDGPGSVEAAADLLRNTTRWLDRSGVVIVGWGLGGAAALAAAQRGAANVKGLVLVGAGARFTVPDELLGILRDVVRGRRPQHFGAEAFAPGTSLDVMKVAWTEQVRTDPRVWLSDLELLADLDVDALARGVGVPVLAVTGAHDRFAPPEAARDLASAVSGAPCEIVDDAGHALPIEQPARLATLIATFVEGLS